MINNWELRGRANKFEFSGGSDDSGLEWSSKRLCRRKEAGKDG